MTSIETIRQAIINEPAENLDFIPSLDRIDEIVTAVETAGGYDSVDTDEFWSIVQAHSA